MTQTLAELPQLEYGSSGAVTEAASIGSGIWKRFRRHPGAITGSIILLLLIALCVFAPLSPYDPEASNMAEQYQSPSWSHLMGTDALGRDMFTRVLYGG